MVRQEKYNHNKIVTLAQDNTKAVSKDEWNDGHNELGMSGHGTVTTLTISSGAIIPIHDMHIVAGEGAANDNLDTITNTESAEFDEVKLFAGSQTITVRNGVGNIFTLSGDNDQLSTTVSRLFVRRGTDWYETGGSGSSKLLGFFGDGSDGDVTISSNTTLTETKFYNNLTINAGITLDGTASPQVIYVKDTLTINGTISMSGKGTSPTGAVGGDSGDPTPDDGLAGSAVDAINMNIAGATGPTGNGAGGAAGGGAGAVLGGGGGGNVSPFGSTAGGSGVATPSPGAATPTPSTIHSVIAYLPNENILVGASGISGNSGGAGGNARGDATPVADAAGGVGGVGNGGAGGTGGNGNSAGTQRGGGGGGGGGAGGGGGDSLIIAAKRINLNASGIIESNGGSGGAGGTGGNGASSGAGGGGGGGAGNGGTGGNGGFILLFFSFLQNSGTITVSGGTGGNSGTGGSGGTGANPGGAGGPGGGTAANGVSGIIVQFPTA